MGVAVYTSVGGAGRGGAAGPPDPLAGALLGPKGRPAPEPPAGPEDGRSGALASGPEQTEAGGQVTAALISSPSGS